MVTTAIGRAAPDMSFTDPVMEAVDPCPKIGSLPSQISPTIAATRVGSARKPVLLKLTIIPSVEDREN
jgi:hypothetical protein